MTLNEVALIGRSSGKDPAQDRLEALAALWARQTGRSIVVSPGAAVMRAGRG